MLYVVSRNAQLKRQVQQLQRDLENARMNVQLLQLGRHLIRRKPVQPPQACGGKLYPIFELSCTSHEAFAVAKLIRCRQFGMGASNCHCRYYGGLLVCCMEPVIAWMVLDPNALTGKGG